MHGTRKQETITAPCARCHTSFGDASRHLNVFCVTFFFNIRGIWKTGSSVICEGFGVIYCADE